MNIDKNIPIPKSKGGDGAPRKYPFHAMEVGDSVFYPDQDTQGLAAVSARNTGHKKGMKFTARTVDGGVRIWRKS